MPLRCVGGCRGYCEGVEAAVDVFRMPWGFLGAIEVCVGFRESVGATMDVVEV